MAWYGNDQGNCLWYEDSGAGTPIIFIHGWCMSSAVWEHQRERLVDSFRVITLDLPGHGNSPVDADGFHIRESAVYIAGLIEHLSLYDAIVAGWSLGTFIAVETYLLSKNRVSGLVLISGTPRFVQSDEFPYGLSLAEVDGMAKKIHRNIRRALDGFLALMMVPGEDDSGLTQRLLSSVTLPTTEVALQALESLAEADMRDQLAMITIPTLIISGNSDVICLPEASEYMSRHIPGATLVDFTGCGHVPFLMQSSKFNTCLEIFRKSVSGGVYRQE
jgi:pimeloyl-[acyl-carrier protein] methyl ester esterase